MDASAIAYRIRPNVTSDALNALFAEAWPRHKPRDFAPMLAQNLTFVCAYQDERLIGFVNLAWDGGSHAFVLNPTVNPDVRRTGIGRELIRRAVTEAERAGIEWVHVDFEPHLREFYLACGFSPTDAGLLHLGPCDPANRAPADGLGKTGRRREDMSRVRSVRIRASALNNLLLVEPHLF